jgi:hypothetical protein
MAPTAGQIRELTDDLARTRAGLIASVHGLPAATAAARPAEGDWSVAEILDHLRATEARIVDLLVRLSEKGSSGAPTDDGSLLDRLDVREPRQRLVTTMAPPSQEAAVGPSLAALGESRRRVLESIERARSLDRGGATFPHPFFGALDFWDWALFVSQHEERHTHQIRNTLEALRQQEGTPAPAAE